MKFVCLGYTAESAWENLSEQEQQRMMESCFDYDDELRRGHHFLGGEALDSAQCGVTLRMKNGVVDVTDGPYAETKEVLGGILLLEARDLNHAIALMSRHPGVKAGPFEIRPAHAAVNELVARRDTAADEAAIRGLIDEWSRALESKDLDGLVAHYATDAVLFDACPPYKTVGAENIRKVWERCLPHFPDRFSSEHKDLEIRVDRELAFVHGLHHFVTQDEHPCGLTWMRISIGYTRIDGAWKVIHEHVSIPFNPMDGRAWHITDPEALDMPSYGEPVEPVGSGVSGQSGVSGGN